MGEKNVTQCANPRCTCHTQNGAKYCSESCSRPDASENGCRCGHAGCAAADYVRYRIGNARYEAERADRIAARGNGMRPNSDERRIDPSTSRFESRSDSNR
jgi:hypothetical protein